MNKLIITLATKITQVIPPITTLQVFIVLNALITLLVLLGLVGVKVMGVVYGLTLTFILVIEYLYTVHESLDEDSEEG